LHSANCCPNKLAMYALFYIIYLHGCLEWYICNIVAGISSKKLLNQLKTAQIRSLPANLETSMHQLDREGEKRKDVESRKKEKKRNDIKKKKMLKIVIK